MIKTYRKVATIQAEQFGGSTEMINRYNIDAYDYGIYLIYINDRVYHLEADNE